MAPQSVLAPVGMVGMLFSLMAAQHVHGDDLPLGRSDVHTVGRPFKLIPIVVSFLSSLCSSFRHPLFNLPIVFLLSQSTFYTNFTYTVLKSHWWSRTLRDIFGALAVLLGATRFGSRVSTGFQQHPGGFRPSTQESKPKKHQKMLDVFNCFQDSN